MKEILDKTIAQVRAALQEPDAFHMLPEILEILIQMSATVDASKTRRQEIGAGLAAFITDDYEFSESKLGRTLLKLIGPYVDGAS